MQRLLYHIHVFFSRLAEFFSAEKHLHNARFARVHELADILTHSLPTDSLILGMSDFSRFFCVRSTQTRRELGNLLICGPTRSGKGLAETSLLLTWKRSVVVNDLKGELHVATAGYRQTLGKVYVIDPAGVGHQYDPLLGRESEDKLYSSAKHLLFEPNEGDGIVFTQRATKMLTQLFLAARKENLEARKEKYRLLPYVRQMVRFGLKGAAQRLYTISPELATQFLDGAFEQTNFDDDRFLLSAWGTLSSRIWPLLTEDAVRCFDGSDFTAKALMYSKQPITVYLRWPEPDLPALSPLIRLVWESLIHELITTYDRAAGKNCQPVLLLIDEASRCAIPNLPEYASTVCGRAISLLVAIQSLSQLDAIYGKARADDFLNNCESHIYYRPSSQQTAEYLERCLGKKSGFAHSQSKHGEVQTSEGASEQAVALMTAQAIKQLRDDEIIGFHRNLPPFQAKRMDWRRFSLLRQRQAIPPPKLSALPPLDASLPDPPRRNPWPAASWHLTPDLLRWGSPLFASNGLRKKGV